MNKILYFALVICCAVVSVSCDDDVENPYSHVSSISIVSSDLSFDAQADRGVVKFSAPGTVTARTTADWCTASVEGDSVVVNVEQNKTINGRSAQLILSCGNDTQELSIIQLGIVVQLGATGIAVETDEATTVKYSLTSNVVLSVAETSDWISANLVGDSLEVSVTENATGAPRIGYVKVASGEFSDSLKVVQSDFEKDVAGTYRLYYKMANGTQRSANVTVSSEGLRYMTLNIPMTYDPYTAKFTIQSGQYVGRSESNDYVYIMFGTEKDKDGMSYWSSYSDAYYISAPIEVASDGSVAATFFGTLGGYKIEHFIFRCFSFGTDTNRTETEKATGLPDLNTTRDTGTSTMDWYSPYLTRTAANAASTYVLR